MKSILVMLTFLVLAGSCFALPTPPATTISIDAYSDPDAIGFWLYIQDGQACDPAKWSDARRVDLGLPTLNATTDRSEWDVSVVTELKATDCVAVTAYDAAGNESAFSTIVAPGDNVGWFGIPNGKGLKVG